MDHHATTPVDPRVLEKMLPYFNDIFGNAASVDHGYGNAAQQAVEDARALIAKHINAREPGDVIFTSGATESDNIALTGIAEAYGHKGNHIVTSAIEHKAILDTLEHLGKRGVSSTILPVDSYGMVDPSDVANAITDQTILVSIMMANNEIGTIQPIKEIGAITRSKGIFFHTDAAQAVGHIPVDVEDMNIDLMSFTAHKLYGPKGIGALYIRRSRPRVKPGAVIHGGGHERGVRSGTLNVPGIVGFAEAIRLCQQEMPGEAEQFKGWVDWMLESFHSEIEGVERNGHPSQHLPHNLNVYIPGTQSRALLLELNDRVAISTGSACTSATIEPSHVIEAMGFSEERAYSSLRFGLGRFNTLQQVKEVTGLVVDSVGLLRNRFSQSAPGI